MKIGAELAAVLITADGLTRHEIAARTGISPTKVSKLIYSAVTIHGYLQRSDSEEDQYDYKGRFNLTKEGKDKLAALASGEAGIRETTFNKVVAKLKAFENAPVIIPKKGNNGQRRAPYKAKAEKPVQQNLKLNSMSETQRQALLALQDSFAESSNSHQALLEIYEICKKYFGGE